MLAHTPGLLTVLAGMTINLAVVRPICPLTACLI